MKTAKNISITMPPEMLRDAAKLAKKEGRTMSELIREAFRRYAVQTQFKELQSYGIAQSKKLGLKPVDVPRLIQEVRGEKRSKKNNI